MQVEVGTRVVTRPTSGQSLELEWGKDEHGQPMVLSCMPLPPQAQVC